MIFVVIINFVVGVVNVDVTVSVFLLLFSLMMWLRFLLMLGLMFSVNVGVDFVPAINIKGVSTSKTNYRMLQTIEKPLEIMIFLETNK